MAHEVANVLCKLAVVGTVMCIVPSVGEHPGEALVVGFGTHALVPPKTAVARWKGFGRDVWCLQLWGGGLEGPGELS